jgi:hypothetical protein
VQAAGVTDPYECWLYVEQVPAFLRGLAERLPFDVDDVLDRLLDTHYAQGRWLVLPVEGPVHLELAAEPGTGVVEVRARPTGPGSDELLGALGLLGGVYTR